MILFLSKEDKHGLGVRRLRVRFSRQFFIQSCSDVRDFDAENTGVSDGSSARELGCLGSNCTFLKSAFS